MASKRKKLAEQKAKEEARLKSGGAVEWRDHSVKLSYLKNMADPSGHERNFVCLCKRFRTAPTFRVYEADERQAGKLIHVKRNIFVAPYELVELVIVHNKEIWYGKINYQLHNIIRRKATKDDTWPAEEWLDKVLNGIQDRDGHRDIDFIFTDVKNRMGGKDNFELEIKQRINGRIVNFINKCLFTHIADLDQYWSRLNEKDKRLEFGKHTVLPKSLKMYMDYIYAVNLDAFIRLCKTGKVEAGKAFISLGYVDIHALAGVDTENYSPVGDGWCALQHAAYNGRRLVVNWLIDEMKVDMHSRSKDGWTAMHCACKNGHFEIAKELYNRGMDMFDETVSGGGGLTPLLLMLENKHMGMVRWFIGEDSKFAQTCYKNHGIRPTSMPADMYLVLKPLPPALMKEIRAAQKIKLEKIAAKKRQELLEQNNSEKEEKAGKNGGKSSANKKGSTGSSSNASSRGGKKGKASASLSPSGRGKSAARPSGNGKSAASPSPSGRGKSSSVSPSRKKK
jgi:hypothetical protein